MNDRDYHTLAGFILGILFLAIVQCGWSIHLKSKVAECEHKELTTSLEVVVEEQQTIITIQESIIRCYKKLREQDNE